MNEKGFFLIFFACTFSFLGGCLSLTLIPSLWVPIILSFTTLLGFFAVCAIAMYLKPKWHAFLVGLCFGIAPGSISSVFIGMAIRLHFFPLDEHLLVTPSNLMDIPWIIYPLLGALFWALAAIPICAIFRWIFAQRQKG